MLRTLQERFHQGYRTMRFPKEARVQDRFRGLPIIDQAKCDEQCTICVDRCPTDAIEKHGVLEMHLGRCLFCSDCVDACPNQAVSFSQDYRLSVSAEQDLHYSGEVYKLAHAMERKIRKIFGRSLKLREVSAGGCNGCEVDTNVLNTLAFDLGRFGIQFVASPRHADGLLLTGMIPENMKEATLKTYDAIPDPKIVIAVGACAISGGPFRDHPEVYNGASTFLPVDLYVPGCPPHPLTILDGMLRLLGRLK